MVNMDLPFLRSLRRHRICVPGIFLISCAWFGVTLANAQDVSEAARQGRARKESQQKKSKHVYTEEDLKHPRILTQEDRAKIEARKNQQTPPAEGKTQEAIDAQSLPPDAPLGDVARHFRKQKQSQRLQQSAEFHLPFADAPVLASPKPPVQPVLPHSSKPFAPGLAPYQPPVKHSPFARPNIFMAAPPLVVPSRPPAVRLVPSQPVAPLAPFSAPKLNAVTVKRGDSLWRLAQRNLGHGLRWHDLLTANPGIHDPNHIEAGSQIYLPTASSSLRRATEITVQSGDTLSKIAQTQLGHASYTACIAHANPAILDANLIYAGQVLILPGSCTP